jgi:hypothetical protein
MIGRKHEESDTRLLGVPAKSPPKYNSKALLFQVTYSLPQRKDTVELKEKLMTLELITSQIRKNKCST